MIVLNQDLIHDLNEKSFSADRKRAMFRLHKQDEDPIQRMFNALQPGTYVQPHKHENPDKREIFILISGKAVVVEFDNNGEVIEHTILSKDNFGVELAPRIFHCLIPLEKDTVVFEIKDGPFLPTDDKCFASWAPKEGDANCSSYNNQLLQKLNLIP